MSLKMGPMLLPSYKQEWEKTMAQRYKDGNFPSSGPDCFEAWLSERAYSLRDSLNYANAKAGRAEQEARAYKKQRNIALVLCVVFFALALLFAFRPAQAAAELKETSAVPTSQNDAITFTEWTRRQNREYVASVNSDKYHRLACDYVDNILEENKVYYKTPADAERDDKYACSVCRP